MAVKNRKEIEKLVYDTFDALDPSGTNTLKWKVFFGKMDDAKFQSYMKDFLANPEENFILDINEFDRKVTMKHCEAAAKVLGIPLTETVIMPHLSGDPKRAVATKQKCIVGWINVKRTQQLLHKKNGLALANDNVYHLTGQVIGDDKDARSSDMEAMMLVSLGADSILQELHGPRSDDLVMSREMMEKVSTQGYVRLEDLTNLKTNKITLNAVNAYLLGMQLKSDIITDSYVLPELLKSALN